MTDEAEAGIQRTLGRIEGKLDGILATQTAHSLRANDVEKRVQAVETKLNWYSGAVAAFAGLITFFGDKIRAIFFG